MEKYDPPLALDKLPEHLVTDPVHRWRAETGIELVHKEPTIEELVRIWKNWKLMPHDLQQYSNEKSKEFFGVDNETHYKKLILEYK